MDNIMFNLTKALENIISNNNKNEITYVFYSARKNKYIATDRTDSAFFKYKKGSLLTDDQAIKQAYKEDGLYSFVDFIKPNTIKSLDSFTKWLTERLSGDPLTDTNLKITGIKPSKIELNCHDDRISLEKWLDLALNANEYRDKHESRAVYNSDDGIIYCNARQAIINTYEHDISNDGKSGDQLYKSTKNGKLFMRKRWFVATPNQIIPLIYNEGLKNNYSVEDIDLILSSYGLIN